MSISYNELGLRVMIGGKSLETLNEEIHSSDLECPFFWTPLTGLNRAERQDHSPLYSVTSGICFATSTVLASRLRTRSVEMEVLDRQTDFADEMLEAPKVMEVAQNHFKRESSIKGIQYVDILPIEVLDRLNSARVFDRKFVVRKGGGIGFSSKKLDGDVRLTAKTRRIALRRLREEEVRIPLKNSYLQKVVNANYSERSVALPSENRILLRIQVAVIKSLDAITSLFSKGEVRRDSAPTPVTAAAAPEVRRRPQKRRRYLPKTFHGILSNIAGRVMLSGVALIGKSIEKLFGRKAPQPR